MDQLLRAAPTLVLALLAACSFEPAPPRPLAELSHILASGDLLARRAAIVELFRSAPSAPGEVELLAAFARQRRRARLRRAALAALDNARIPDPSLIPAGLRLAGEEDSLLSRAGVRLCLRMGLDPRDARLTGARHAHADLFAEDAEAQRARLEFRGRAERAQKAMDAVDARESLQAYAEAERLVKAADSAGLAALLEKPAFRAGGYEAGRLAARAGRPALARGVELARSQELFDQDAGLGVILFMRDPAAVSPLRLLARGEDEAARSAREALAAMKESPAIGRGQAGAEPGKETP